MGRAATTIVWIETDGVVRADFGGGGAPKPAGLWRETTAVEDLASAVETALYLGPGVGRRVLVLCTDLWTQTVELPARAVAGVDHEQLAQALAFETEALAGAPAADAAVGFHELKQAGSNRRFWVTQATAADLAAVDAAVRRSGSRLEGMAHPAGVKASLDASSSEWRRVELWPGMIVGVERGDIALVNLDPRSTDWRAALRDWLGRRADAPVQRLAATEALAPAGAEGEPWRALSDEATLGAWLGRWAAQLGQPSAPLVRPARRPMSSATRAWVTAAVCALALAACAGHYTWMEARRAAAVEQADRADEAVRTLADLRKQDGQTAKKVDELDKTLRTARAELRTKAAVREAHRRRWAGLLAMLARHSPADLVVREVRGDGYDVVLAGVCLRPELANELAERLNDDAPPLGWRVQPPRKQAMNLHPDGSPYSFELTLRDAAPSQTNAPALVQGEPPASGGDERGGRP